MLALRSLDRKLLRDAWHLRGQILACAVVVACGVAAFVTLFSTYQSLVVARDTYYGLCRFADVFVQLKRAPQALADRLRVVPGVGSVQTRIVVGVNLDVPGLDEPARGRVVSLAATEGARETSLNAVHLRRGRLPEPGRQDEAVASEAFANANRLGPGNQIHAVVHGRRQVLHLVGVAISPEYIYEAGPGTLLPDNRRFGVLWMDHAGLAAAFDMTGAFNDVAATLAPGAREPEVLAELDRLVAPYGGLGAYGREEHFSHRFISDEITQNRVSATTLPLIFLFVGAFLLHTILSRLVQLQRTQIGLLKAFGYSSGALVAHYLKLVLVVMAIGTAAGIALAIPLADKIAGMYADFYRFPVLRIVATSEALALAVGLVGAAALAAAWRTARRAARLPPAEAMRPPAPATFGLATIDRSRWLAGLSPGARIVVRNIARRPWRALANVLGIALALGITVVSSYFRDSIELAMHLQFAIVQREDLQVVFNEVRPHAVVHEVARLPGVQDLEPYRAVGARLRHGHKSRRIEILGLDAASSLRLVVDRSGARVAVPEQGLLVNTLLAELLGLQPGDTAEVDVLEGQRPNLRLQVAALVAEPIGLGVYMDRQALARALGEGELVSGALLRVAAQERGALHQHLKSIPAVAGVSVREAALVTFQELIASSFLVMVFVNLVFAGTIAFGIVYNGARIALSERGYELATLRVLGFSRAETARILLFEQGLLTAIGIPIGFLLGAATSFYLSLSMQTELYRLPFVLTMETLGQCLSMLLLAALVSGAVVAWRLRRLDLIAVLKARE